MQIFTAKLREMEGRYRELARQIETCQEGDREALGRSLDRALARCREEEVRLEEYARNSRSRVSAELASAQLDYCRRVAAAFQREMGEPSSGEEAALWAEYAMDLAGQAVQSALLAALYAMTLQEEARDPAGRKEEAL